jgi:hypothetical protein
MFSAEAGLGDAHARQVLRMLAELPTSISKPALHYLALFRNPDPQSRGLRWDKVSRLLAELKILINETHVQHKNKPARPSTPAAWGRAMEQMVENPPHRLPLKSHGYLAAVAYDICNEVDRSAEVRRNKAERSGSIRQDANGTFRADWPAPPPAPPRKKGKYSKKYPTLPPLPAEKRDVHTLVRQVTDK